MRRRQQERKSETKTEEERYSQVFVILIDVVQLQNMGVLD